MLPWYPLIALTIDAMQVAEKRLCLIASGEATANEMLLMVTEKLEAWTEAHAILFRGGDCRQIINNYSRIVAENTERLSA